MRALDHRRLVFLDESGAKTNMTRLYGRAGIGRRALGSTPASNWSTTTMMAALGAGGADAPFVLDGAMDGDAFGVYVERVLAPTVRPGDVVVMDNLSTHRNKKARAVLEKAGASVKDLPPYSPDFNPIEKMWSKVKAALRKTEARTQRGLVKAVGAAIGAVTREDIQGWFKSCGYDIT
jgi:transposase